MKKPEQNEDTIRGKPGVALCLWCHRRPTFGGDEFFTSHTCKPCLISRSGTINFPLQGEWSRHARRELDENAKDVLQPLKKDGTINKHFVQVHGTRSIEKEMKISKQKIHESLERY